MIQSAEPHIEEILEKYKTALSIYFSAYRNHVYRVYNLTLLLYSATEAEKETIAVAAAFHDIGIWTDHTFDYLQPSIVLATKYCNERGISFKVSEVATIIDNHHKLTAFKTNAAVEAFRRADLIDLSFNLFTYGIEKNYLNRLNKAFPGNGFHRFIFGNIVKSIMLKPCNPLPMVRL